MEGYPQARELLQKAHWLEFMEKFDGFHKEVTKTFARVFYCIEVEIGDIKFTLTESLIEESTGLPRIGEKWFKNRGIKGYDWRVFLKKPRKDIIVFRKCVPM